MFGGPSHSCCGTGEGFRAWHEQGRRPRAEGAVLPQSGTPAAAAVLHNHGHCMSMGAHRHGPAYAITAPRRRLQGRRAQGSCGRTRPGDCPHPPAGALPTDPARGLSPLRVRATGHGGERGGGSLRRGRAVSPPLEEGSHPGRPARHILFAGVSKLRNKGDP